jgi:hypothetical protein
MAPFALMPWHGYSAEALQRRAMRYKVSSDFSLEPIELNLVTSIPVKHKKVAACNWSAFGTKN